MRIQDLMMMEDLCVSLFTSTYQTKLSEELERIERFGVWRMKKFWEKNERNVRESLCFLTNEFSNPLEWGEEWIYRLELALKNGGKMEWTFLYFRFYPFGNFFKLLALEGNHNSLINDPMRMEFFELYFCKF